LVAIYRALDNPTVRADVLRVAILYLHGGVYLDLDTVTRASLLPLLGAPQFVGCELIVWPHFVRSSRSPIVRCRASWRQFCRETQELPADPAPPAIKLIFAGGMAHKQVIAERRRLRFLSFPNRSRGWS
jgi:hypothetical protein